MAPLQRCEVVKGGTASASPAKELRAPRRSRHTHMRRGEMHLPVRERPRQRLGRSVVRFPDEWSQPLPSEGTTVYRRAC